MSRVYTKSVHRLVTFALLLVLVLASFNLFAVKVRALPPFTQTDFDFISKNEVYRDTREIVVSCLGNIKTTLVGTDNQEKSFNYFIDQGLTAEQAAGIVGNMIAESGVEPKRYQGYFGDQLYGSEEVDTGAVAKRGDGWGIVQWTPSSKIIKTARSAGIEYEEIDTLDFQLQFLWNQLNGTSWDGNPGNEANEQAAGRLIFSAQGVEEAARLFGSEYERFLGKENPDNPSYAERIKNAETILALYGSNSAGSASNPVQACVSSETGEVVSGYSLPLPRSIFAQDPSRLSNPHHNSKPAIDIGVQVGGGEPVFSVTDGTVVGGVVNDACGDGVAVQMDNGILLLYCHGFDGGSVPGAQVGDTVKAGQFIMTAGYTGNTIPKGPNGAHLHLQISVNGTQVCPQPLLEDIFYGRAADITQLTSSGCTRG